MTFEVNAEGSRGRRNSGWLTLALVCLLVALLSGVGGTLAAFTDAQKHSSNAEYFDGQLVWERNEGTTSTSDDGNNRIVPTQEKTVVVAAQNVGTEDMFARMSFNLKWVACEKSADGTTYTKVKDINAADAETVSNGALFASDKLTLVPDSAGSSEKWTDGEDGYYYYDQGDVAIPPSQTTEQLNATVEVSGEVGDTFNDNLHHELSAEENRYVEYAADGSVAKEYYTGVEVDAHLEAVNQPYTTAKLAKTGDTLMFSPLTIALFTLMVLSFIVCVIALVMGRRKRDSEGEPASAVTAPHVV